MSRILFIANCMGLYGANRSMLELAAGLQKLGQEIFFFFPQGETGEIKHRLKEELDRHGFRYAFLEYYASVHTDSEREMSKRIARGRANLKCLAAMESYVKKWKVDIIHTNSLTHTVGALLGKKTGKPHVWHIREALKDHYGLVFDSSLLYGFAIRETEQVICISDYIRKVHNKMLRGVQVSLLYDGLETDYYVIDGAYRKDKDIFRLLICGVINEGKGQWDAVRAVEILINRYKMDNVHLHIVGDGSGEYFDRIKDFIRKKGIGRCVELMPFQGDLRELRREADIALMCSRNEALGRVTIESMLSENLVIGADSAGTAEIIEDGINGYLYEVGNARELSKKIYNVITHWGDQEIVIKRAKEYARLHFDMNRYAQSILCIYRKLL